jgi:hypothetical protein
MEEGPLLETLTRRLAECPADFLSEPRVGAAGQVRVAAVVADLLADLGGLPLTPEQAAAFDMSGGAQERNWLRLVLLVAWLLHAPWFVERGSAAAAAAAFTFLQTGLTKLAEVVKAPQCLSDPDRREELARLCLQALGLRPAGETDAQAQDRLRTLDTVERRRVISAARTAEARARAIREAMAQKAAQETADKWTRE